MISYSITNIEVVKPVHLKSKASRPKRAVLAGKFQQHVATSADIRLTDQCYVIGKLRCAAQQS